MQPRVPLRLGARYRIVGALASGGMGAVQLALRLDPEGRRTPVAIKQLHAHLADDAEVVSMFLDEARIASRIAHPNVVRVHDVEMLGEDVVLVMEFVEGVPLSTLLRRLREEKRAVPVAVVRRIVHDVLTGLHAAHELRDPSGAPYGVVHRDVSPHNVLVGTDGVARIGDFGVAKATGRLASTRPDGAVKGKLQYLAPEQVFRRAVDRRTDLFATGAVLWECLTGKKLFSGESEGETLASVLSAPIAPPSVDRFDVPLDLDETCLRALERDPARRFQTAADFAKALESGPLATREEVATVVAAVAAESIAAHRALLADAERKTTRSDPALEEATEIDALRPGAVESPRVAASAPSPKRRLTVPAIVVVALVAGTALGVSLSRTAASKAPASPNAPARASANADASANTNADASASASASASATADAPAVAPVPDRASAVRPSSQPARSVARPRTGPRDAGAVARPFMPDDL